MTPIEQAVHDLGVRDGMESRGKEFTCGMTYDDPALNEIYDMGVNRGRADADILMSSLWSRK